MVRLEFFANYFYGCVEVVKTTRKMKSVKKIKIDTADELPERSSFTLKRILVAIRVDGW